MVPEICLEDVELAEPSAAVAPGDESTWKTETFHNLKRCVSDVFVQNRPIEFEHVQIAHGDLPDSLSLI